MCIARWVVGWTLFTRELCTASQFSDLLSLRDFVDSRNMCLVFPTKACHRHHRALSGTPESL